MTGSVFFFDSGILPISGLLQAAMGMSDVEELSDEAPTKQNKSTSAGSKADALVTPSPAKTRATPDQTHKEDAEGAPKPDAKKGAKKKTKTEKVKTVEMPAKPAAKKDTNNKQEKDGRKDSMKKPGASSSTVKTGGSSMKRPAAQQDTKTQEPKVKAYRCFYKRDGVHGLKLGKAELIRVWSSTLF